MGNEGRSGGPQGSKSTRSSEEPEVGLRDSGGLRELASETVRALPHCRANGSGRHGGDADPAGAELVSQPLAQRVASDLLNLDAPRKCVLSASRDARMPF